MMDTQAFKNLPDDATLWIYGFEQPLGERDQRIIAERLSSFVRTWDSHKIPVQGAFSIVDDYFVLVAGHTTDGVSGCSIDGSIENFKFFRDVYGLNGLNRNLVYSRNENGEIEVFDRAGFQTAVDNGRIGENTTVFDITIHSVADLRAGKFETAMSKTWHAAAFFPDGAKKSA
jgi:hypothetical protein